MFADTEVVSLVNSVKLRLGVFTVFCWQQPDQGQHGVNTSQRNQHGRKFQMTQLRVNFNKHGARMQINIFKCVKASDI